MNPAGGSTLQPRAGNRDAIKSGVLAKAFECIHGLNERKRSAHAGGPARSPDGALRSSQGTDMQRYRGADSRDKAGGLTGKADGGWTSSQGPQGKGPAGRYAGGTFDQRPLESYEHEEHIKDIVQDLRESCSGTPIKNRLYDIASSSKRYRLSIGSGGSRRHFSGARLMSPADDENRSIGQEEVLQQVLNQEFAGRNIKRDLGFGDDAPDSVAEQVICEYDDDQEELEHYIQQYNDLQETQRRIFGNPDICKLLHDK